LKKKLIITVIILITLINIFSFLHINKNAIDKLLFDKTTISFYFYTKDENEPKSEFLEKIEKFSEENDVEIAQYSFLSSNKVDIYSTMKDKYKEALFVPNFIFNRDIKVHSFEKILDVGFKNSLYIDTKDNSIINNLSNELKDDCELYELESSFKNDKYILDRLVNYLDINSFPVFAFLIFLFILIIFFYYSNSKKEYIIHQLWGYTHIQTYLILNISLYKSLFLAILLSNLAMSGIIYKFVFSNILFDVLCIMMILNIAIMLLLFLLSIALFSLVFAALNNNNRKKGLSKIIIISYFSKFLLLLLIIFLFKSLSNQTVILNESLDSLTLWKNTKNLFNLHEIYSPFYHDNLANEDILNNKILRVYKDLSSLDKVFLISTLNFERSTTQNLTAQEGVDYNYKINVKNEEDLYSPYGRNIVVDKNYLKRHVIKAYSEDKNVLDIIDSNDNILNVLVPQKFRNYENLIENSFKEWFYFQKVEVPNIYKKASNQKGIEKNIDDLKINIIYIENNQHIFTYNPNSGDSLNTVEDPIITVYTENIDNSFLAASLGGYLFMESKDEYSALKEISTITQKYNAIELNSISSVYDKKGQEIRDIEDSIDRLMLNAIVITLLLIMFMIVITYAYYKSFISTIIIKSLHGHHFTYIYKYLILANLFINISVVPIMAIIYKKISLNMIIFIGLMSIIDYLIARMINAYLLMKSEIQFIKGEL
jgi:putative ABC transport system permease protein